MPKAPMTGCKAAAISLLAGICLAQTPPQTAPPAEIASSAESKATFSTRVNLVTVPVVVRNHKGNAIGTLTKEDFQLFDKGKLQTISKFTVEKAGERAASEAAQLEATAAASGVDLHSGSAVIPTRFVAYVVDDAHVTFGDLVQVRNATVKHLNETLQPTDRAAVFTTSGIGNVDFTDDKDKLIRALNQITPRSRANLGTDCPPMTLYMADLIVNHNDPSALNTAAADAIQCASLVTPATLTQGSVVTVTPQNQQQAVNMAQSAASRSLALGEAETQQALGVLKDVIRRMSLTPGLRSIVLISPGFLINTNYRQDEADLMDRAVRANVTINTLDPRGLYVPSSVADASKSQYNSRTAVAQDRFLRESELAEQDTIAELAEGTGGTFFHNSNDYAEGLKQTAAAPEYIYLLGFSPQNLKYDGSFHGVKVTLKPKDLSMQARRGYYAPRHAANEEEQAKQEIKEAMFSREEVQEFPIQLQSQFFKVTPDRAKLAIVAHIDLKLLKFQKMEGRDKDTLTIVSGLFDRNGNMLAGTTKTVEMRLKEENFANHLANGLNVKTSFDVQPGKYLLRLVVRDSEGQMMSARNGIVDIP